MQVKCFGIFWELLIVHFEENIKFCPYCAGKVIRYGKPKYKELPNWDWLEEFRKIIDKTYRYLEYKIHCELNDIQRKVLIKKAEFGEEYFGKDNYYPVSNGNICWIIRDIATSNIHYTTKKKLEKEFNLKE